jgi:hypothetical protein
MYKFINHLAKHKYLATNKRNVLPEEHKEYYEPVIRDTDKYTAYRFIGNLDTISPDFIDDLLESYDDGDVLYNGFFEEKRLRQIIERAGLRVTLLLEKI